MMRRALATVAVMFGLMGTARSESLTTAGVDLGRIHRAALPAQVELLASADQEGAARGFMIARFQNNQPLMKSADGSWQPWNGDAATLEFVNVSALDGVLRFPVGAWPTEDVLAPCTFTFGYQSAEGLKFGYFTVDGL